jgi:hypothetical protein
MLGWKRPGELASDVALTLEQQRRRLLVRYVPEEGAGKRAEGLAEP